MKPVCANCNQPTVWRPHFAPEAQCQRCEVCGSYSYFGVVEERPADLYGEHYFSGGEYADYLQGERAFGRNFERTADLVAAHGRGFQGARVVELGCATGLFLQLARRRGAQAVLGIEASEFARNIALGRGLEVLSPGQSATQAVRRLRPNLLLGWDVWEHLRNPAEQVDELLQLCEHDVTVAFTTVDSASLVARARATKWRQFHPPTHLHYPTRRAFELYLGKRGFKIGFHSSVGYSRPLLAYLQALRLEGIGALRPLHAWPLYLNLGDIQLVVATRKRVPRAEEW